MGEGVFDRYSETYYGTSGNPVACSNCANYGSVATTLHGIRGGDWDDFVPSIRAARRTGVQGGTRARTIGFRCAKAPL
jgi:formylglycine-generating enzyme required for sulfatase activity